MNHGYIIKNNIIDLYLKGNLPTEESDQFELHYVDCERCLRLIEMSRAFKYGLRLLRDDQVWEGGRYREAGPFGWLAQFNRSTQVVILTFVFALLLIPMTALATRLGRLQGELNRVKSSMLTGEAAGGRAETDDTNANEDEQLDLLKGDQVIAQNEKQRNVEQGATAPTRPQINTSIFVLSSPRSAASKVPPPVNEFVLRRGARLFVLSVDLEEVPQHETYHVAVTGNNKQVVWQSQNLTPDEHNSLVIVFPGNFLKDGVYKLDLGGVGRDGKLLPISNYVFRIIKRRST